MTTPQWQPQKLQDWHHRVIDMLIADPTLTNEQLAFELNCNVGKEMIGLLRRTEMFRLTLEERRDQISRAVDQHTSDRITGKLQKLAELSIDTVTEQLDRERKAAVIGVSNSSLETCEMVLKSLGYAKGGNPPPASVQQVIVQVNASDIDSAREKMRTLHARVHNPEPAGALPPPQALRAG